MCKSVAMSGKGVRRTESRSLDELNLRTGPARPISITGIDVEEV